jgi:RNA polymerase sigma-70 factor (ECF subfamily)
MSLAAVLLAHAGPARERLEAVAELEARVGELLDTGREAWPQASVPPEAFARHLGERLADADEPAGALTTVHAADLYLACGCALGDGGAVAEFDRHYVARAQPSGGMPTNPDEFRQMLRERLLAAAPGQPPRIAGYTGRGPLGSWLGVVVARLAVDLRRSTKPETQLEEPDELRAVAPDPEMQYLKTRYRREFEAAFQATLADLSTREANVLRLFYSEGMTTEAIGDAYKVSDRTVQRWIAAVRQKILDETHRRLSESLKVSPSEMGSILALVRSQVNVSLTRRIK